MSSRAWLALLSQQGDVQAPQVAAEDMAEPQGGGAADAEVVRDPTQRDETKKLECRFFQEEYPEVEELVMVKVVNIADMAAEVVLLEYNDIEGMILHSELSRRRIRSIKKLIRVGKLEVVQVLRVDQKKGYIDLSKRRVLPEDVEKCEERYNQAKAVHSVLRHVAQTHDLWLEDLYKQVGWPLYKSKYKHAYKAFEALMKGDDIFKEAGITVDDKIKEAITDYIKKRLAPRQIKIRSDIEVTCFTYEGIDAIKAALRAGLSVSDPDVASNGEEGAQPGGSGIKIEIKLIAPPLYVVTTMTYDKERGIAAVREAIERIGEEIKKHQGKLEVKMEAKEVGQREDAELQGVMDEYEDSRREVDGDEPEDA